MKSLRLTLPSLSAIAVAVLLSGCGNDATPTGVAPVDSAPPAAPTALGVDTDQGTGAQSLVWEASTSPSVTGYQVFVYSPSPARDNAYVLMGATSASTTSFPLPGVAITELQFYRVRALAGSVNGTLSNALEATLQPPSNDGDGSPGGTPDPKREG
ncbi:MAG: hypothetical protein HZC42_05755 [Candidatus Eisenbacteria bacterium]|nr:hypothetical protein [Candidatus Eisenbacteria bacterium]